MLEDRNIYAVFQKNTPSYSYYSFVDPAPILIIFGTNVTEKLGSQKILYFPTSPN